MEEETAVEPAHVCMYACVYVSVILCTHDVIHSYVYTCTDCVCVPRSSSCVSIALHVLCTLLFNTHIHTRTHIIVIIN